MMVNGPSPTRWRPLPKIGYGFVIYPFSPSTARDSFRMDLSQSIEIIANLHLDRPPIMEENPYQIALEVGDEVYVFEEYNGWYRGYVVSMIRQTEEPQVFVGIFPANHVYIREYLEDAERRLANTVSPSDMNNTKSPSESNRTTSISRPKETSYSRDSLNSSTNSHNKPPPPLPSLKCGDETLSGTVEPLIDEIASALREWSNLLYKYLDQRKYDLFNIVKEQINYLFQGRRHLLAQTLSQEEMVKLRKDLVNKLVAGNLLQNLDIIVRHPDKGCLADETNLTAIQLFKMQAQLAYSGISPQNRPNPLVSLPTSPVQPLPLSISSIVTPSPVDLYNPLSTGNHDSLKDSSKFYHVFLDLRAFVASISGQGETSELYFSLYNRTDSRFLTEEYCVILTSNGMPKDESKIGRIRTLFMDLSHVDPQDQVYIVCRIIRNGQMKFDSKDGSTYDPTFDSPLSKPSDGVVGIHDDIENGGGNMVRPQSFRRPFGCAVLELSQLHSAKDKITPRESIMPIFTPINEASFATLHEEIINGQYNKVVDRNAKAEMVCVYIQVFHGESNQIIRENPSLLQDIPLTSRLGFPDVVFPGHTRNELYLKLWSGDFTASRKSSLRNIQVTVEVRLNNAQRLDRVISRGSGEPLVSQFDSMIFYHNNIPTWGELMKICVPINVLELAHLFFTFRHRSTKDKKNQGETIFAFAYIPLFPKNRTFVHDGAHTLALFKYDRAVAQNAMYLKEPYMYNPGLNESLTNSATKVIIPLRDNLTVRTFLCSTKYTQNEVLLKLLDWEHVLLNDPTELHSVLSKFAFVGEVEIVKFLQDIFDALFGILSSMITNLGEIDDLVINAMVTVLGIVADRRFVNFRPVLDLYIEQHFNCPAAASHMMKVLNRLLTNPASSEKAQVLRSTIKVWEYIFKFIIRARELQREKEKAIGLSNIHIDDQFKKELESVLHNVNILMTMSSPPAIIGTQTVILQHFASILPDLGKLYDQEDLLDIVVRFVDSIHCNRGKMLVYKLLLIQQLCKGILFENSNQRRVMIANVIRWISPHFNKFEEDPFVSNGNSVLFSPTSTSLTINSSINVTEAAKISWHEGVRLCVSILALILDKMQEVMDFHRHIAKTQGDQENELRHDAETLALMLPLLPNLLEAYKEFQTFRPLLGPNLSSTIAALTPVSYPTVFPTSYPFSLFMIQPNRPYTTPSQPEIDTEKIFARFNAAAKVERHKVNGTGDAVHAGLGEVVMVILVLTFLTPTEQLSTYFVSQLNEIGTAQLSKHFSILFRTLSSILRNEAYPADWLNINIFSHKVILKLLEPIADILEQSFIPDRTEAAKFDTAMWRDFFTALLTLISSDQLVIEDFSAQKRRAVWRLAGDVRGDGARILADLWQAIGWPEEDPKQNGPIARIGGYQVQFIPGLVEPILELCLSHHDELRNDAVQVLFSMIVSEYNLNEDITQIEVEAIEKLDKLFMSDTKGDEISRAFFIGQLRNLFETSPLVTPALRVRTKKFLDSVNHFLDLLLGVRNLPEGNEYQDDRIMCTLKLMKFIKGIGRDEIYIKYVHQLVSMQLSNHNYVEAGLTMKLHADLYEWNKEKIVDAIPDVDIPKESAFLRKEMLYLLMLDYFTKGKAWESAIQICKELAHQYETYTFNYTKLAELLQQEAILYDNLVKKERYFNEYFRVGFYGRGFPSSLQNKQYIYRGFEWEKIGAFCERMQNKHPSAQLLKANTIPPEDILLSDGQFLQVTAVTPEPDRSTIIFTSPDVPTPVRNYYERNQVNKFSFSRPVNKNEDSAEERRSKVTGNEFVDLWTEKTTFTTDEVFPTVLRRSEVIEVTVTELSPIENAVIAMEAKNRELIALEAKYTGLRGQGTSTTVKINTNPLSMALNGAVDAPVNGGVPLYKKAFFGEEFITNNPNKESFVNRLKKAIDSQVEIIDRCLVIHDQLVPSEMRPFHDTLVKFFNQNFAEEITRLPEKSLSKVSVERSGTIRLTTGETSIIRPLTTDSPSTPSVFNRSFVIPPLSVNSNGVRLPAFGNGYLVNESPISPNSMNSFGLMNKLGSVNESPSPLIIRPDLISRKGSVSSMESSDVSGFQPTPILINSPTFHTVGSVEDVGDGRSKPTIERKPSIFRVPEKINNVRKTFLLRQRQTSEGS